MACSGETVSLLPAGQAPSGPVESLIVKEEAEACKWQISLQPAVKLLHLPGHGGGVVAGVDGLLAGLA